MSCGSEPTTAIFLSVLFVLTSGIIQPSLKALSIIDLSILFIVTGLSSMFKVHAASHGAEQIRDVNSGKLFVE